MMGLGYLGNGLSPSSASSNLSPLAPPFTVDRSNQKSNSNPLVHFTEPSYAVPFSSSLHNWQYSPSSAPRTDFFYNPDSEFDSIRTNSLPSANDHSYVRSESISSLSSHWPPLDPGGKTATDSFSYLGEPKPYYPPHVSPVVNRETPSVALNEPSYDLLSTSGLVSVDGSCQVDYTQSLSGLEYAPQWRGIWNGLAEGKRCKRMEVDGSFCSEETNIAGQGSAESLSKGKEDSAISHGKYGDVFGRENHTGSLSTEQLDEKSFLVQNLGFIPVESSKTPIFKTGSVLPEPHTSTPLSESATNYWNHQKPYIPYEKRFQLFDSCMNDCISVTKSSPLVVRPPAIGHTFSATNTVASKTMDVGDFVAINSKYVDNYIPSEEKAPHLLLSSEGKEGCLDTNQLRFFGERNDHNFVASSSTKGEWSNKPLAKNALDHTRKARSGFPVLDINGPNGFSLAVDGTEAFKSTANSSESLDSPCWKGAPSAHSSPFEVFEVVTPQHIMKKLEGCNDLNLQGTPIFPPYNDSIKASSQELYENSIRDENVVVDNVLSFTSKRTSEVNLPTKEHKSGDAVKAGSDCAKLSSSKGVLSFNDIDKPRKEYMPNESKSVFNSNSSHTKQLSLEEDSFTSKRNLNSGAGVVDAGMNTNDASKDDFVPFYAVESVSCLLSSGEEVAKLTKPHGMKSTPKMNVQILVNAMHNLSELLLFHCSNDASELNEQDHGSLEHVIGNLDACMSKRIVNMTTVQESMFPQQGTSHKLGELTDLRMGSSARRPQVTNEIAANSRGQLGCRFLPEQKRNHDVSGKKIGRILDFVSLRDDADVSKDHNMVQAIKNVLDENFQCEEELESQTLLFKNLWLESEAELCCNSYRARFARMKIEMEKCKSDKAKDVSENTKAVEELLSSKVSPDQNITQSVTLEANDSPNRNTPVRDTLISSSTSHRARIVVRKIDTEKWNSDKAKDESENTKAVETLLSSEVSLDPNITHSVAPEANNSPIQNTTIRDTPISSSTRHRARSVLRKIDTEKWKSDKAKDESENTKAVEKLLSSEVSPDPNITHSVAPEANNSPIQNTAVQDTPISSSIRHRARILLRKIDTEKGKSDKPKDESENTKAVEKLLSSEVSPDPNITLCVAPEANNSPIQNTTVLDTPVSSSTRHRARILLRKIDTEKWKSDKPKDVSENTMAVEKLLSSEVSPDPNITHNLTPGANDNPISSSTCHRARFGLMKIDAAKCKADKAKDVSENTMAVEKHLSSEVSRDPNITLSVTPEANDSPIQNITIRDAPSSSSTRHVNKVDASVVARFHILKCRHDNSNCFASRNNWPIIEDRSENKSFDVAVGPRLEHHTGNGDKDEFGPCMDDPVHENLGEFYDGDDPAIQSGGNNGMQNRVPSRWYDSSSSDWEHVLNDDEFAWQN